MASSGPGSSEQWAGQKRAMGRAIVSDGPEGPGEVPEGPGEVPEGPGEVPEGREKCPKTPEMCLKARGSAR
jgi:hypothetical protein